MAKVGSRKATQNGKGPPLTVRLSKWVEAPSVLHRVSGKMAKAPLSAQCRGNGQMAKVTTVGLVPRQCVKAKVNQCTGLKDKE